MKRFDKELSELLKALEEVEKGMAKNVKPAAVAPPKPTPRPLRELRR